MLKTHVEEAHLVPMGWQVGDGPANDAGLERPTTKGRGPCDIPSYLMDGQGRQVTPSIEGQEMEDLITWRNNRRKLRELLRRRDENLRSESDTSDESDSKAGSGLR